jgi:hypothetical protein
MSPITTPFSLHFHLSSPLIPETHLSLYLSVTFRCHRYTSEHPLPNVDIFLFILSVPLLSLHHSVSSLYLQCTSNSNYQTSMLSIYILFNPVQFQLLSSSFILFHPSSEYIHSPRTPLRRELQYSHFHQLSFHISNQPFKRSTPIFFTAILIN